MKDLLAGTGVAIWVVVLFVALLLGVGVVGAMTNGWFYSRENANIRHSIGYTTAANQRCSADIQQYLDAQKANDTAHMAADLADCQAAANGLAPAERDSNVAQFLATH